MEEGKNPLMNDSLLCGITATINDKVYNNKDIVDIENKNKLVEDTEKYEDILSNIDIIKTSSEKFLQSILDNNPTLKNIKEKKNTEEIEQES